MKLASQTLCVVTAGAALLIAGCQSKPTRPDPSQTAMGMTPGGGATTTTSVIPPSDISTIAPGTELEKRPDGVIDDGNTIRGLLQPVYFDFDRSDVKAAERPKLQAAKEYLDKNPGTRILLEGHCDWRGTAEYNLGLGDRRANAAKKYLISLGVPKDRVESNSKGSLDAAKNADDQTMVKDRRAEIVIVKAKQPGQPPAL